MKVSKYKFYLFSEDPDELVKFYRDVMGFPVISELKLDRDYGYMVEVNGDYQIWIAEHSEVKGRNKDSFRHILTFYTDGIEAYYEKIKAAQGVEIVEALCSAAKFNPDDKRMMFTFLDPEGNCLQFIENR